LYLGGTVANDPIRTPEATMPDPTPRSAILVSPSVNQPGEIESLNTILEKAGLGRPLGLPERSTPAVAVVPVSGDPEEVVTVLRRVLPEDDDVDVVHDYSVDTVDPDGKTKQSPPPTTELFGDTLFSATGLKSGHGTVTWTPIEQYEAPQQPPWPPAGRPPVVVVLDSGVRQHSWLPPQTSHPSFFIVEEPGPSYGLPVPDLAPETKKLGAYWGHATFLAGLIRLKAPDAQVVSLRVMNNNGKLHSDKVVNALYWLHDEYMGKRHRAVDVVLMAFGRAQNPGEADQRSVRRLINKMVERKGVQFVASAGNDHSHQETFPACLEHVVGVGAGTSAADHEPYSNHGPWVDEWRPGTHVSLMPLTARDADKGNGYAVWSGTSFSAAIVAAELAQERAASGRS
jgi:subtilisin family serine protease